jgi:transcriptional regulator with XRE-family HTH domain
VKTRIQQKIRDLRRQKGLTLKQLAEGVGCTQSYISQLEKGLTAPSLSMVGKLAAALNIRVVDLFSDEREGEERDWHLRKVDRRRIAYPDGKVSSQLLTKRISNRRMEPLLSRIKPGGTSDRTEKLIHPAETEEFVFVMEGGIEFQINGKRITLEKGDTLYFDGSIPHRWLNPGTETAEVLFVFSPPIW